MSTDDHGPGSDRPTEPGAAGETGRWIRSIGHRDDDNLPPYAPRTAAGTPFRLPSYTETRWPTALTAAPADVTEPGPVAPSTDDAWDAEDVAEEAAAFAEARQQGLLPAGFEAPVRRVSDPAAAEPVDPEPTEDPADTAPADTADAEAAAAEAVDPEPADPEPADQQLTTVANDHEPSTTAIPLPDADVPAAGTAASPTGQPQPIVLPGFEDESPAERAGAAKESRRQRRQREAAATLAATRTRFRDEPVRTVVRGLGQLLITLGVVVLLFVVYEVYITDIFSNQKQAAAQTEMETRWAQDGSATPTTTGADDPADDPTVAPPVPEQQVVEPADRTRQYTTELGEGFANLYIPVFGVDYVKTILEGTSSDDLARGPGHYEDSQYPGELGNFAVAGHRVSKGSPFSALGTLSSCDAIVVETKDDWFVYRVLPMAEEAASWNPTSRAECADIAPLTGEYQGVVGREITLPSDYPQVLPVPGVNATGPAAVAVATQRLLTLTTCHPQFSDRERMIIHATLVKSYAKADGFLPPELSEV